MNGINHAACNLTTGEIITCERANCLKKRVAYTQKINREQFNISSRWIWAHGKNAVEKVYAKALREYLNS